MEYNVYTTSQLSVDNIAYIHIYQHPLHPIAFVYIASMDPNALYSTPPKINTNIDSMSSTVSRITLRIYSLPGRTNLEITPPATANSMTLIYMRAYTDGTRQDSVPTHAS
jgi:hypothetical protein